MTILRESIAKEARMSGMPEDIMLNTTDDNTVDPVLLVKTGRNRRL
jgi:hypothetical protein